MAGFFALFALLLLLLAAIREVFYTLPSSNPTNIEVAVETVLHQGIHDPSTLTDERKKYLRSHGMVARRCLAAIAAGLPPAHLENAKTLYRESGLGRMAVKALKSWSRNARLAAAIELGALQHEEGIPGLLRLVKNEDVEIRAFAAKALARIGRPDTLVHVLDAYPGISRASSQTAAEVALTYGIGASQELQNIVMYAQERHSRLHAIETLGLLGDRNAVPLLIEQLQSNDREIRTRAARALGAIGDSTAGEPLMALLSDGAWEVRAAAALALGRLGISEASPYLARATFSSSWWVRRNAEEALGRIVTDISGPPPVAPEPTASAPEQVQEVAPSSEPPPEPPPEEVAS